MNYFSDQNNINAYNNTVSRILKNKPEIASTQDEWTNIMDITKQAAVETLGYVSKIVKYQNHEIKELSKQQKKINLDENTISDHVKGKELKTKRNKILSKIHSLIKTEETDKIENQLLCVENAPDDSRRIFEAVKNIKNLIPKTKLLIQSKNGLTANDEEKANIIANYFKSQFYKNGN